MNAAQHPAGLATQIIAIRHGQTEWNAQQRVQGHVDVGLNERGRAQARRLAQALADESLDAVYASDLSRAADTARAFARPRALPVILDDGLRERAYGEFEGHTYEEIGQRWPEGTVAWRRRDPNFSPLGGESLTAFHARAVATVVRLARQHPGGRVAVVSHGGVLDALYRAATRAGLAAPRSWQLSNASINRLLLSEGGLVLVGWDDCRHLDDL